MWIRVCHGGGPFYTLLGGIRDMCHFKAKEIVRRIMVPLPFKTRGCYCAQECMLNEEASSR